MILDASVVAKWFLEERDTPIALRIRDGYVNGRIDIEVPDLILYEIANVLRYKKFSAKEIGDAIKSILAMDFLIITPTETLMDMTAEISIKYDVTIYDAVYVALGKYFGTTVITADRELYEKTKENNVILLSQYDTQ